MKGGQVFTYRYNSTICPDRTICPNQSNNTCCSAGAGRTEILFHYTSPMPSTVRDLSVYYALAGYSIPFSTTSSSSPIVLMSPTPIGSSTYKQSASATSTSSSSPQQSVSFKNQTPNPAPSGLSNADKAGIAVGNCVAIALLVCLVITFLRRQRRRENKPMDPLRLPSEESQCHWPVTAGEALEMNGLSRRPFEVNGESTRAELGRDNSERCEI